MLLKPLTLVVAGLAGATQAFLLPPDVSEADVQAINTNPIEALIVPDFKLLKLACPGCPLAVKGRHGATRLEEGRTTQLMMAFNIDHQLEHDRFLVNHFEIYPSPDPLHSSLRALVVPEDEGKKHKKHRKHKTIVPTKLGYSLVQTQSVAQQDGLQLIDMDFHIIEVGTMFVDTIPNVHIKLVRDADGKLAIVSIEATESPTSVSTPLDNQEECANVLCKWMAIVKDKLAQMKAGKHCGGTMGAVADVSEPDHPHHHHNHHNHGGHSDKSERPKHRHSWRLLFKNIAAHILLPIAIGIVAGVTVSVVGMMVATVLVKVFRAFFRRPSRRHAGRALHRATRSESIVAEEEKSGLIDNQDAPPSYEDEVPVDDRKV